MNQPSSRLDHPTRSQRAAWLKQSLCFLGGLGILSSGLGWTQAIASTETLVIPESPSPTSEVKPESFSVSPTKVPKSSPNRAAQTKPILQTASPKPNQPKVAPKPSVSRTQEAASPKVKLSAPKILDPATAKTEKSPILSQPKNIQLSPSVTSQGNNGYIDTTSYGNNTRQRGTSPSAVVLTERSTGCQTIAQNGQLSRGGCGTVAKTKSATTAAKTLAPRRIALASRETSRSQSVNQSVGSSSPQVQPIRLKSRPVSQEQVVSLQPIGRQGLSIGLEPLPRYNQAASMYAPTNPQQSRTDLIFPLPVVASITSAFGWRIHPIAGTGRMHNGTDIGAPQGTPVVASYAGEVSQANWLGGYGLTVVLRHLEGTQESLYAHLSEIYVQPGEWVEQGTVIGRVGSTGYSTGPHLHFEWRHLTEQGWVAVDAGLHLEYALENLIRTMQIAQTTANPEG